MASESSQQDVWKGHPSQLMAFRFYLVCALLAVGLLAISYIAYTAETSYWSYPLLGLVAVGLACLIKYVLVRSTTYTLSTDRLIVQSGLLSTSTEEMELYRVRDWSILQPFWLRLFGLGHVRVVSNDATAPDLRIEGIVNPSKLRELLRNRVEAARDDKRVRHVDIEGGLQ